MIMNLLSFFLVFGDMSDEGWVSVERQENTAPELVEDGSWPVFIRQFGMDRITLRFPGEPSYEYPFLENEDTETVYLSSQQGDVVYRFLALTKEGGLDFFMEEKKAQIELDPKALLVSSESFGEKSLALVYRSEEQWVHEKIFSSEGRIYILQTVSPVFSEKLHDQFVQFFDWEKRDASQVFHREIVGKK